MQSSILRVTKAALKQPAVYSGKAKAGTKHNPSPKAAAKVETPAPLRKAVQIPMARNIARRHGYKAAATYLRKRGWSFDAAVWILLDAPAAPVKLQPVLY